jgi:pyridoxal phosphate-dependent aminotransferase EpsN
MSQHKRIYLSPPHMSNKEEQFIQETFRTNWIAPMGPQVEAFEKEMAAYVGVKGALALSSGTAALHLILRYLGVGPGDIVLCSTLTFIASANPILYQGATPVFVDSEPESWNLSPAALERALALYASRGRRPKAVVVVHLYGQSADMDTIIQICEQYEVPVIEDAAESLGSTYLGKASGSIGRFGFYSFNGNKIITTSGGGMIVSNDLGALGKMKFWATQARDPELHYQHSEMGYNYRLSNILAAIGRAQLIVLPERVAARRKIFETYKCAFSKWEGISFMPEPGYGQSTRWLTALTIDPSRTGVSSREVIAALELLNIEARMIWKPMHLQPLFRACEYFSYEEGISFSDQIFEQGICLPSGSSLSDEDLERIIESMVKILSRN